jgi:putative membrane protein
MREIYDDQFRQHVLRFQALDRQATQMADQSAQRVSELSVSARFDLERTRIAYEQLMMSWIRTATSLITFGFSIYKFFQIEGQGNIHVNRLIGPRGFALMLVVIGLAALALATLEYRQNIRIVKAQYPKSPRSLSGVVAALISLLGIAALIAMIFRQ